MTQQAFEKLHSPNPLVPTSTAGSEMLHAVSSNCSKTYEELQPQLDEMIERHTSERLQAEAEARQAAAAAAALGLQQVGWDCQTVRRAGSLLLQAAAGCG